MDHETIEASVTNGGEALKALGRLREALQTLPFFGGAKVVWFRDCNFLADDRVSGSKDVTEGVSALVEELKGMDWRSVRLLLSAGKVDRRKSFYKTLDKLGTVESFDGWDDKEWADQASQFGLREFRARGKDIQDDALAELIQRVGPNARALAGEVEKLTLYVGDRPAVALADVEAVAIQNKFSRAFALGDALGRRDLPGLLRCLDEELWEIRLKVDKSRSEFGLLYGLITKTRQLLQLKELTRAGWLKPTRNYGDFQEQLRRVPADALPEDRRYNPLASHPYPLFSALGQSGNYTQEELLRAMEQLLQCNVDLIFSNLDEALVLQRALVEIVGTAGPTRAAAKS